MKAQSMAKVPKLAVLIPLNVSLTSVHSPSCKTWSVHSSFESRFWIPQIHGSRQNHRNDQNGQSHRMHSKMQRHMSYSPLLAIAFLSGSPKTLRLNARCARLVRLNTLLARQHGLSEVTTKPSTRSTFVPGPCLPFPHHITLCLYHNVLMPHCCQVSKRTSLGCLLCSYRVANGLCTLTCVQPHFNPFLSLSLFVPIQFFMIFLGDAEIYSRHVIARHVVACMLARSHGIGSWCGSRS